MYYRVYCVLGNSPRGPADDQPDREFGATTCMLHAIADGLPGCGVDTLALRSTRRYLITVRAVLGQRALTVWLVDAPNDGFPGSSRLLKYYFSGCPEAVFEGGLPPLPESCGRFVGPPMRSTFLCSPLAEGISATC